MDSDGALRDILAEDPADEAPAEASGVAGQATVMEADTELTSPAPQFEAAAGLESDVALDDGLVRDVGEQTLPYVPDSILQGAHRMDAEDWCPAHLDPVSAEGQDILFEVLGQRGIPIPPLPDLGTNKDPPVLIWPRRSRRHKGSPYWAWLSHCSGRPPGSGRRRRR